MVRFATYPHTLSERDGETTMTIHHIMTNGDAILMGLQIATGIFFGQRLVDLFDWLSGRSAR